MRLLVATPLYPPEPGGPATYAKILEGALPGQGIQTAVLPFAEVRRFPKVLRHIAYFSLVLRAGKDADAILALDPVSTGLPAVLAGRLLKKPVFVKIVGDYAWEQGCQRFGVRIPLDEFVRTRHVPTMVGLFRRVQTFVAKSAARVIVPSDYLKGIVTLWGVDAASVDVIYNAMQEESLGEVSGEARAMGRPKVVSIGRLVPWKGMPGVIEAMARVREELPEASLLIAGDGPEYDALARYAHVRLGDGGRLLGRLSHADTLALIADADVFVLNSTYEGLSHLLIEALALGKAVIATDVGGNPELVEDGKNGLLVPVGDREALQDAILHLLKTPEHRQILGTAARATASRFSTEAMVARTAELLTRTT